MTKDPSDSRLACMHAGLAALVRARAQSLSVHSDTADVGHSGEGHARSGLPLPPYGWHHTSQPQVSPCGRLQHQRGGLCVPTDHQSGWSGHQSDRSKQVLPLQAMLCLQHQQQQPWQQLSNVSLQRQCVCEMRDAMLQHAPMSVLCMHTHACYVIVELQMYNMCMQPAYSFISVLMLNSNHSWEVYSA